MSGENSKFGARSSRPQELPIGWHGRGYLPHFNGSCVTQFVTFRLYDSLPRNKFDEFEEELKETPIAQRQLERYRKIEKSLDLGIGACVLKDYSIGLIVENALLYFHECRYLIHAWVIMPNHVHTLITPMDGWLLSSIVRSWKSFTSKQILRRLRSKGPLWQPDYFDRYIRSDEHYRKVISYIEHNPVAAGLVSAPNGWRLSSATRRFQGR